MSIQLKRCLCLLLSLCILISSGYLLFSGSAWLSLNLVSSLPLGNLLAAFCLIVPSLLYFVMQRNWLSKSVLLCTILWLPASMLLAGNLQLRFDEQNFAVWIGATGILSLTIVLLYLQIVLKLVWLWLRLLLNRCISITSVKY